MLLANPKASLGWKQKAFNWIHFSKKSEQQKPNGGNAGSGTQTQRNTDLSNKRTSSISSENFSSRSDSWRQANIPMKLIDRVNHSTPNAGHHTGSAASVRGRRNSWNVTRKVLLYYCIIGITVKRLLYAFTCNTLLRVMRFYVLYAFMFCTPLCFVRLQIYYHSLLSHYTRSFTLLFEVHYFCAHDSEINENSIIQNS